MDVDALLEAIYRQLCARQRAQGAGAEMSLADLRVALGVANYELREALMVARLSDDRDIRFTSPGRDRVTLGSAWRRRCENEGRATT